MSDRFLLGDRLIYRSVSPSAYLAQRQNILRSQVAKLGNSLSHEKRVKLCLTPR